VVCICNGILIIKGSEFEPEVVRWMNLEPLIQSEVSQKEKNKYHIYDTYYNVYIYIYRIMYIYRILHRIMYIYRIQKNGTDESSRQWTYEHSQRR